MATAYPARITHWRKNHFDRTTAGQAGAERVQFWTGLGREAIRKRLLGADDKATVATVFADRWPKDLRNLGLRVQEARDQNRTADLAAIVGATTRTVTRALNDAHGNALVRNVLKDLGESQKPEQRPSKADGRTAPDVAKVAAKRAAPASPPQETVWRPNVILDGQWELVQHHSDGAFGDCWRAIDRQSGSAVIAKRAKRHTVDALKREAAFLNKCDNPNIVRCLDSNLKANPPYIVLEDGGHSLLQVIQTKGALKIAELLRWLRPVAAGLDYLHFKLKIVHHDVSPGNVVMDETGGVRLIDLGAAANLLPARNTVGDRSEVASRHVGHTPGFAAREVLEGKGARKASDQTSLARVAVAAATALLGEGPAQAKAATRVFTLAQLEVLAKAQAASPRDRYPSCELFVAALAQAR